MKKFFSILIQVLFFTFSIQAQSVLQWAKDIGTPSSEYASKICSDNQGNSYVVGSYYQRLIICNDTLRDVIQPISSNQTQNLFISKFDSNGNCIWTKTGISIVPSVNSGAIAPEFTDVNYFNGDIFCVGVFTNKMIFDNDTLFNSSCTNYCTSTFIIKIDTSGKINWSKCLQGSTSYSGISAVVPYNNGVFVSGSYQGTILVDGIQLNTPNSWNESGYLLKFNNSGVCLFGKNIGNSNLSGVSDLVFDKSKNLYITAS